MIHITILYLEKLLTQLGFHSKITDLWRNAICYTSWWYQDWWEFITLEMGWVLSDKDIEEAKKEANMNNEILEYVLLGTLLAIGMVIRKPSNGPSTSTMITAGRPI